MVTLLTIGEVSRRSGVAASALRFYEERGLIASERAGSGHRRYPRPVLRRIAFIVFAQRVGLTLEEIGAELAKLPPERAPNRRDWSRLSRELERRGSMSGSPSSSASGPASPSASGAAACRSSAASSPIPATAPPGSAPDRATGSGTAHRADAGTARRRRSTLHAPMRSLLRAHWPLLVVLAIAAAVRVAVAIAYQPAIFFGDSWAYLDLAYGGSPVGFAPDRPSGYPMLIDLLSIFGRSLGAITTAQHLAGLRDRRARLRAARCA